MDKQKLLECLYEKYIAPTERKGEDYIGIEIEMPIVNLSGEATDFDVARAAADAFIAHYGLEAVGTDKNGNIYSATDPVTGDNLSFDCSYNNLEFSFAKEKTLGTIDSRFREYVRFLNNELSKSGHILTGMGISPYHKKLRKDFLPVPRYQMLEGFLARYKDWKVPMYFHPYPDFATYASASQVQLDIEKDKLINTIHAFTKLEPLKAVIFANSWTPDEPEVLCIRDRFWENCTHGINPHNIGMYERMPDSIDELVEYISRTSIFCTMRDGHYLHFRPIPIIDYFDMKKIDAEYYEDGVYTPYSFTPAAEDIEYLRSYKFIDLTFRGTIEYRSACCQPFNDAMSVAALQLGLEDQTGNLKEILDSDETIYHHGYSAIELRNILNLREWPEFIDRDGLSGLIISVLELAKKGLIARGAGDERFLEPLFDRAERLSSPAREMVEGLENSIPMDEFVHKYSL